MASLARAAAAPADPVRYAAASQHRRESGIAYDRLMLVLLLFFAAIFLVSARLAQLQLSFGKGGPGSALAGSLSPRGEIVDRNGVVLATTIDAWTIGVQPDKVIGDKAELAARLNELMPEQSAEWYRGQLSSGVRFTYLRRRAEPDLVRAVNALGEPGITFGREGERLYPQGPLGGHILGFVGADGQPAAGIERALQDRLTDPGRRSEPLALSIDTRVQAAMEEELGRAMASLQAQGGSGIVLDVETGEVIALASAPLFNPNVPGQATQDGLRNNAIQGVYELGSTFKPLTVATALDAGLTTPSERWDAVSPVMIGRHAISDSHPAGRWLTVPEVLTKSSNLASARIADRLGIDRMDAMFRKLHFNEKPALELHERAGPLYPRQWSRANLLTSAFGHGLAVTPLHLATGYAALVNGGIWRPATLLRRTGAVPGERVFSEETSFKMRQMLRLIVTNGSGRKAGAEGFRVGGKTGTAEKAGAGGYSKSVNVSTFASAFPMDRPRYVVLVMIDAPKGNEESAFQTTAAWTAAPVVKNVIERTGALLGVIPSAARDIDLTGMSQLVEGAERR